MNGYDFSVQLKQGEKGEQFLDTVFVERFEITPATPDQQRQGIDRIFRKRDTHQILFIEYKTDAVAHRTGNAFIETVSVDTHNKAGWALTSKANYLCYWIVGSALIYIISFKSIHRLLPRWYKECPTRSIRNTGYNTIGLLVPLEEFEAHAYEIVNL